MNKIKTYFSLTVFIFSIVIVVAYYQQVAYYLSILLTLLVGILAVSSVMALVIGGLSIYERYRVTRARRRQVERDADVMIVNTVDGFTFVRDTNHRAQWHNLSLEQRVYSNGKPGQPTVIEAEAWKIVATSRYLSGRAQREALALPAPTQEPLRSVDLLTALDSTQRCLIVGASNAGKTTLLQHIVNRRLQSSKVIVVDPHAYPSKWNDCEVIGLGRDYARIDSVLNALVQLMTKRYDEIGKGIVAEGEHGRVTILIDEWRAITANLGKSAGDAIKTLLTESRKAAFSVFVATHSDRAKPLGLEGEYDLKDGFTIVYLTMVSGQRQAYIDSGDGRIPATLPGPYHGSIGNRPSFIEGNWVDLEVKPTSEEKRILEMAQSGDSFRTISQAVYGQVGQFYNDKIQAVLNKFGEK